jgi:heme-degrading monooxygenase HmoA
MTALTIDLDNHSNRTFRIDAFAVPDAARAEFEAAMRRNLAFLNTVPGFLGHMVFEKDGGPSTFNIVTIAVWENGDAQENAGAQVRAYYQSIGFDLPAELSRWGVRAELGNYSAPRTLQ